MAYRWYLCRFTGNGRDEANAVRPVLVSLLPGRVDMNRMVDLRPTKRSLEGWGILRVDLSRQQHNQVITSEDVIYLFPDELFTQSVESWPVAVRTRVNNALAFAGLPFGFHGSPRKSLRQLSRWRRQQALQLARRMGWAERHTMRDRDMQSPERRRGLR